MNGLLNYFDLAEYRKLKRQDNMYHKALIITDRVYKSKDEYIDKLYSNCDMMNSVTEKIVFLLKDIITEINIFPEELLDVGFSDDIVNTIKILTQKKDETKKMFIERIINSNNSIALKVKLVEFSYDNKKIKKKEKRENVRY